MLKQSDYEEILDDIKRQAAVAEKSIEDQYIQMKAEAALVLAFCSIGLTTLLLSILDDNGFIDHKPLAKNFKTLMMEELEIKSLNKKVLEEQVDAVKALILALQEKK